MPRNKNPSTLISFRLNPKDANFPSDSDALAVYRRWRDSGKRDREIMTAALLVLDGLDIPSGTVDAATKRLLKLATRLEHAIEELSKIDRSPAVYTSGEKAGEGVDFSFLGNILGQLRVRVDDDDE